MAMGQPEKKEPLPLISATDVEHIETHHGGMLVTVETNSDEEKTDRGVKLAKDGKTILIPQPSEDPNDPLNWSSLKKHVTLLLVSFGSFAGDFGAAAGVPAIFLQAAEWGITPERANQANSIAALMCGISGLIWMPLLNSWGRAPVLFWSTLLGLSFTIGATVAPNFRVHFAMRVLQSGTQSTGQTIGLAFVEDCFFFHLHAQKIGIWYAIYLSSPFLSPMLANFIIGKTEDWRIIFWCIVAVAATLLAMILAFGDESYYDRTMPTQEQPVRGKGQLQRLLRVTGAWQIQHHSRYFTPVAISYTRLVRVFVKPVIALTMVFYAALFMWFIGINTSSGILLSTPATLGGYGMSPIAVGYVYFSPIVAVIIGEIFGHFGNDYIFKRHAKRHAGHFVPETRLYMTFTGLPLMLVGLVLVGQTLQYKLNVAGVVFGWGMYSVGVMVTSVATVTFALNCYPTAPGEVSALINLARVGAGFSVPYFLGSWTSEQGFALSFGLQAVVVAVAYVLVMFLIIFGGRLRIWAGPVSPLVSGLGSSGNH